MSSATDKPPQVQFCPYCGSTAIRKVRDVPRCDACRAVFIAVFSRFTRKTKGQQ